MNDPGPGPAAPTPPMGWLRRAVRPIVDQLRQGVTPHQVALAVALGFALGTFPILGATTVLCGVAGYWLRLNQPVIQVVNYLAYPVQLAALIPFYRAGETLFGEEHVPLAVSHLIERFRADAWQFLADFGVVAGHGIVVWCLVAPVAAGAVYFGMRLALRSAAGRLVRRGRVAP